MSELSNCSGAPRAQEAQTMGGNVTEPIRKFLVRIEQKVSVNQQMQMLFTLTTPPDRGILQKERWRIEVWRKGNDTKAGVCEAVLMATNDAASVPLPVVTQLPTFPPKAPHRPPITLIRMEFSLDPLDTKAQAFVIRAPIGFGFPNNCIAKTAKDEDSPPIVCKQLPMREGRARVRLICTKGGTECMRGLSTYILVSTPRLAPANPRLNIWFIEAVLLDPDGDVKEQLGRAEASGFTLIPMPAEVSYAPMAGVPVDIAVSFRPRISLPRGTQVKVLAPKILRRFGCGNAIVGFVNPLSVGKLLSCTDTRPSVDIPGSIWSVTMVINNTLTPGSYVITIPAETPLSSPTDMAGNIFEVYLIDPDGNNADVALSIPGEGLMLGFRMIAWPLWWGQVAGYETTFQVSVPLELLDDADVRVSMILITLPLQPAMNHTVGLLGDIQISTSKGKELPVTGLMIPDQNKLLLKLDDSFLLAAGLYSIRFVVEVPSARPQLDIWRVAICGKSKEPRHDCRLDGMKRDGRGKDVKAVFALPGFEATKAPSSASLLPVIAQASHAQLTKSSLPSAALLLLAAIVVWSSGP